MKLHWQHRWGYTVILPLEYSHWDQFWQWWLDLHGRWGNIRTMQLHNLKIINKSHTLHSDSPGCWVHSTAQCCSTCVCPSIRGCQWVKCQCAHTTSCRHDLVVHWIQPGDSWLISWVSWPSHTNRTHQTIDLPSSGITSSSDRSHTDRDRRRKSSCTWTIWWHYMSVAADRQSLHKMTSHSHSPGVVSPLITEILLTINSSTVDNRENCESKLSEAMDVHIANIQHS